MPADSVFTFTFIQVTVCQPVASHPEYGHHEGEYLSLHDDPHDDDTDDDDGDDNSDNFESQRCVKLLAAVILHLVVVSALLALK